MYDPSLFALIDVHDADQRASYIHMASAQLDRSSTPVLREHVLWFRAYATICGLLASCACSTHTFLFDFADLHCAQRFLDSPVSVSDCVWSAGCYAILHQLHVWHTNPAPPPDTPTIAYPSDSDEEDNAIVQQLISGNNDDLTTRFGLPVWLWFLRDARGWTLAQVSDMDRVFLIGVPVNDVVVLLVLYAYHIAHVLTTNTDKMFHALRRYAIAHGYSAFATHLSCPPVLAARKKISAHGRSARQMARERESSSTHPLSGQMIQFMVDKIWPYAEHVLSGKVSSSNISFILFDRALQVCAGLMCIQFAVRGSSVLKSTPDSVSATKVASRLLPPEPLHSLGLPPPCAPSRTLRAAVAATGALDTSLEGHALRAQDVCFMIEGQWIESIEVLLLRDLPSHPEAVSVTFVTSKTNQDAAREVKRIVRADSYGNTIFCRVMLVCAACARYDSPEDQFMSRPNTQRYQGLPSQNLMHKRKRLETSGLVQLAKTLATQFKCDDAHYNSKSFKSSGISCLQNFLSPARPVLNSAPRERVDGLLTVQDIVARRCDHASTTSNRMYYHEDSSLVPFPLAQFQPNGSGVFSQESLDLSNTVPRPGKRRIQTVLLSDSPRSNWTPDRASWDRVQLVVDRIEPLAQRATRGQQLQPDHRLAIYEGMATPSTGSSASDGSSDGERDRVRLLRERQVADEVTNDRRIRNSTAVSTAPIPTAGVSAHRPPSSNHSEYSTQWGTGGVNRSIGAPPGGDAHVARYQRGTR